MNCCPVCSEATLFVAPTADPLAATETLNMATAVPLHTCHCVSRDVLPDDAMSVQMRVAPAELFSSAEDRAAQIILSGHPTRPRVSPLPPVAEQFGEGRCHPMDLMATAPLPLRASGSDSVSHHQHPDEETGAAQKPASALKPYALTEPCLEPGSFEDVTRKFHCDTEGLMDLGDQFA